MRPIMLCVLVASLVCADAARAQDKGLQSNHGSLKAVPVRQAVVVDGKLDEWDVSAEMFSYGVRRLRDRYSVRVAAMWDSDALYLGLKWRDPTPMINNVDVDASPGDGWMADSFQGRFIISGRQIHLTTCYSSKKDKSAAVIEYDAALNQAGRRVFVTPGKITKDASGFAQAFSADSDARGYVQELRIPWTLLGKDFKPAAGGKIGFTGEYFWGNASGTTWPAVMWSDPINQKNPVRIVIYQNPGVWGEMELLARGDLPAQRETDDESRLAGPLSLRFEVPADATHFSVVIDDAEGRRVRNLASHQRIEDYAVRPTTAKEAGGTKSPPEVKAASGAKDSASNTAAMSNQRVIEVPWDGRPDGPWNPDRMLFLGEQPVAPGKYSVKCVVHRGVGVTYAGSFYNPGTPPWPTANGSGAWGFDHTNPRAVAAMPPGVKSKGRVFLGWEHGECGVGFIGLDADGRKIWEWLRRGVGATHIATTNQHVYFTFHSEGHRLGRVKPDDGEQVAFTGGKLDVVLPDAPAGLAVRNDVIAVALPKKKLVLLLDAATGAPRSEVAVDQPGSLTILPDGAVLGIRSGGLFRIPAGAATAELLHAADPPLAVASDSRGRVFLSDAERLNVARFSGVPFNVTGRLSQIGEPGGHAPGPWNSQRMGLPSAIAVEERDDGTSRLWVAENSLTPRRVSVWDADSGRLVRDYIGNTRYCASGGFLSDDLTGVGFVDGVKFQLDLAAGTYSPLEILGGSPPPRQGRHNVFTLGKGAGNFANPYHFVSAVSGQPREYIVEAGGTQPMVFMKRGERWQCVAALGSATLPLPADLTKAPSPAAAFSWHDVNSDGYQQTDEFTWHDLGEKRLFQCGWGYRCGRDLVFYHSGLAFRPQKFTSDGVPVYDVTKAERLPGELGRLPGDIHKTRFGYVGDMSTGEVVDKLNVVHGLHYVAGFDNTGRLIWKYPNYWVAVHGAFTAPMAMPGVLMGVLKTTGIIEPASGAGADSGPIENPTSTTNSVTTPKSASPTPKTVSHHDVISLRGNIGQEFLIRDDGVYLGELFTDQRMAPADLPPTRDIVGAPINETTLGGEPFNGWIGRQRDGKVRMTYGLTDVRIAEVVGLDQVADLPPQILTIGEPELAAARAFQPKAAAARRTEVDIPRGDAFTDAEFASSTLFSDETAALVIRSGREELGRVKLRWNDAGLHVACQVADATPFVNKGSSAPLAFKSGDSVSVFACPLDVVKPRQQGGSRVLFTMLKGKPTTVLYRPVGPGDSPFVFDSPVRRSPFAHVAELPDVRCTVQPGTGSYSLRATIPWTALAIQPAGGTKLRGDIGLLFGDDTGANTLQRVHWVDRETNVVNDTPTEAEFFPERWGTWTLQDESGKTTRVAPPRPLPTKGWKTVYRETFDNLPVGLKTSEGALANWEGGSALGVVRDGGPESTSGRYLAQVTAWQHFNFGPVFNLDLKQHPHTHVRVSFNLYTFGDWRGAHGKGSSHSLGFWDSKATHPIGKYFSFATVAGERQSFPDILNAGAHMAATGASFDDKIDRAPTHLNDHRWPMTFEYVSGSDSLRFASLSGWHSLGGPPMPEPTFGLDDIHVEVLDARVPSATQPPTGAPKFRWISATSPGRDGKVDLRFELDAPGFVTLVIETPEGVRVKNVVSETRFEAGEHVVPWDGRDETVKNLRVCGLYDFDPQPASAGRYRVRGLVRPELETRYELTVNNAGSPPWPTTDGAGRWLADHSPPSDVLFLPTGRAAHRGKVRNASIEKADAEFIPTDEPLVLIASHVAESGDGLVWCDLDGKKRRGVRSLGAGGGWCGAERLARDVGASADRSIYAFAATGWKDSLELRTLPSGEVIYSAKFRSPGDLNCVGLAVANRLLALTLRPINLMVLFDTATRKQIGTVSLDDIGGVAFDSNGRLFVATAKRIVRFDALTLGAISVEQDGKLAARHSPADVVTDGLSDPRQLLVDNAELFVADQGAAHQVKVFDLNGKPVRTIGRPGGAQLGAYSPAKM